MSAFHAELLNVPSPRVRGYTAGSGPAKIADVSAVERAWALGEPALPFSEVPAKPEPFDWMTSTDRDAVINYIASTQSMPKRPSDADTDRTLRPFSTYDSRRGDPVPEMTLARRAGARAFSLSIESSVTAEAEAIVDGAAPVEAVLADPDVLDRIAREQSLHYSGPTTRIRRKWSDKTGSDMIVVDRWAGPATLPLYGPQRCRSWWENSPDGPVRRFEVAKPYDYRALVRAYQTKIAAANGGRYPSYREQREMAAKGAQERLDRKAFFTIPRHELPDTDPFRYRAYDADMHEPFEQVDVSDLITNEMARDEFGRDLDDLLPEEFDYLDAVTTDVVRSLGRLEEFTLYHVRGHGDRFTAAKARINTNGAEFLAGLSDAIETAYAR